MDKSNIIKKIKNIISAEVAAIENMPIDTSACDAISMILQCDGKIIISGMGKAGIIAHKMAATLSSTGTPAVFLHPGEAQHGDLGIIDKNDILLILSTSGKTREVIETVKLAQHLYDTHINTIAITSHPHSTLRQLSDIILDIGEIEEPCPLGLTPTASTTSMLVLCDALALVIMEEKGIGNDEWARRHHGGYLGVKARGAR